MTHGIPRRTENSTLTVIPLLVFCDNRWPYYRSVRVSLLTERDLVCENRSYKHLAPLERKRIALLPLPLESMTNEKWKMEIIGPSLSIRSPSLIQFFCHCAHFPSPVHELRSFFVTPTARASMSRNRRKRSEVMGAARAAPALRLCPLPLLRDREKKRRCGSVSAMSGKFARSSLIVRTARAMRVKVSATSANSPLPLRYHQLSSSSS